MVFVIIPPSLNENIHYYYYYYYFSPDDRPQSKISSVGMFYVLISAKSGIHPNPGAVFVSPDAPH